MSLSAALAMFFRASATFSLWTAVGLAAPSFIGPLNVIKVHDSTMPANNDVNPYGVAVVPRTVGNLHEGSILVSNFNDSMNFQGTGTTIVQVPPGDGPVTVFAQIDATHLPGPCPGGVGLTTALAVLRSGWVIVGSLPADGGQPANAMAGCLLVLNSSGTVVETISGGAINGPWDMTALDRGSSAMLFVTNVLDGTVAAGGGVVTNGKVIRIDLKIGDHMPTVTSTTIIGSGFSQRTDPMALVIGATGVGLGLGDNPTLYVADTLNNRIAAIPNAVSRTSPFGTGTTVIGGGAVNGPLGLAIAPNGDIVVVNSNDGNMVEITPEGSQVAVKPVDVTEMGGGTLFGLAIVSNAVYFVNDGNNTLDILQ